ncbi:hypothetical protein HRbin24_01737 [bacterium HR24]|nr:hypothetical protein HRbin24_01737 [bacterium HR24]
MLQVGGGLAVGDHDDLARTGPVPRKELLGQDEGMVHVGAQYRFVPAHVGQLLGLQFAGVRREAQNVEHVFGELALDEVVEGQGYPLGGLEGATQGHGPGQVQHHDGGRSAQVLGGVDLEVVLAQAHRHLGALPEHGVEDGLAQVQVEGVAELVALGVLGALGARAPFAGGVLAVGRLLDLGVDLAEGLLADAADGLGGQLPLLAATADVARLLQHLQHLLELTKGLVGLFAQELPQSLLVHVVQGPAVLDAL